MWGRITTSSPAKPTGAMFKAMRLPESNFPPRYNVAPTDPIPIIRIDPRDGERELAIARWGLIPFWMKERPKVPHIRVETVHKAPTFTRGGKIRERGWRLFLARRPENGARCLLACPAGEP